MNILAIAGWLYGVFKEFEWDAVPFAVPDAPAFDAVEVADGFYGLKVEEVVPCESLWVSDLALDSQPPTLQIEPRILWYDSWMVYVPS